MMSNKLIYWSGSIVLLMLLFFLLEIRVVQVQYEDQRIYLPGDSFQIGWIHSVEKEPWFEKYIKCGDMLCLVETKFKTFGAGVPSEGEIIPSNDGFIRMKLNEIMPELRLFISENVETTIYVEDDEILLYKLMDDFESVLINIQRISLWQYLRGENRW